MLGPEMRIERRCQQQVAQPALVPRLLVQQFVGVDHADGPGHDADPEEQPQLFPGAQMARVRDVPNRAKDHRRLHRKPDHRDRAMPEQLRAWRIGVGILAVQAQKRVERRHQVPRVNRHQREPPAAPPSGQRRQRDQPERHPERGGGSKSRVHGADPSARENAPPDPGSATRKLARAARFRHKGHASPHVAKLVNAADFNGVPAWKRAE